MNNKILLCSARSHGSMTAITEYHSDFLMCLQYLFYFFLFFNCTIEEYDQVTSCGYFIHHSRDYNINKKSIYKQFTGIPNTESLYTSKRSVFCKTEKKTGSFKAGESVQAAEKTVLSIVNYDANFERIKEASTKVSFKKVSYKTKNTAKEWMQTR